MVLQVSDEGSTSSHLALCRSCHVLWIGGVYYIMVKLTPMFSWGNWMFGVSVFVEEREAAISFGPMVVMIDW